MTGHGQQSSCCHITSLYVEQTADTNWQNVDDDGQRLPCHRGLAVVRRLHTVHVLEDQNIHLLNMKPVTQGTW